MPYANRVIHLDFPDISEEGDPIWIKLRNPRFLAPSEVEGSKHANDGQAPDDAEAENSSYKIFARLIIGWHVYDATDNSEDPAPMGPATIDTVKLLPLEILQALGEELAKANPQMPTASPEDGTSKTS